MVYKIFLFILVLSNHLLSQELPGGYREKKETATEFNNSNISTAIVVKAVNINEHFGVDLGARLNTPLSGKFSIGFGLYYLFTQTIKISIPESNSTNHLKFFYGGAELDYTQPLTSNIKLNLMTLVGLGIANYSQYSSVDVNMNASDDFLYIIEPGIGLKYNIGGCFEIGRAHV